MPTGSPGTGSVVRLQLEHLGTDKAFALVRMSRSVDGALMCAKWCKGRRRRRRGGFLLIGRKVDEAFQLARERGEMDLFVTSLGDGGTPGEYRRLAKFFENENDPARAGDMRRVRRRAAAVGVPETRTSRASWTRPSTSSARRGTIRGVDARRLPHRRIRRRAQGCGVPVQAASRSGTPTRRRSYRAHRAAGAGDEQHKMAHRQLFDAHRELTGEGRRPPPGSPSAHAPALLRAGEARGSWRDHRRGEVAAQNWRATSTNSPRHWSPSSPPPSSSASARV